MNKVKFVTLAMMLCTSSMLYSMESINNKKINTNNNYVNISQLEHNLGITISFKDIYNRIQTADTNTWKHAIIEKYFYNIISNADKLLLIIKSENNQQVINDINKIIDEANKLDKVFPIPYGIPNFTAKVLVPFINEFPKNTKLYKLMSTKPNEK